jgi:hypothetical protein
MTSGTSREDSRTFFSQFLILNSEFIIVCPHILPHREGGLMMPKMWNDSGRDPWVGASASGTP